ncbi:MAG: phosphoribosylamine--glycine ligase, partial [Candidatus Saccharimonadales bacterium]
MNILVLGSGGREHALIASLARFGHRLFCHPGNPGMLECASPLFDRQVLLSDFEQLAKAAREKLIDLTVVGPELPLSLGIADYFASQKLALFGPSQSAARLESSKAWSKQFMLRHGIPTARFSVCRGKVQALATARALFAEGKQAVVKPSGLTGGKGVVCCDSIEEAVNAIEACIGYGEEIVIEERLSGPELSLLALCDGTKMAPLVPAQDHKRLYNGGLGPNTGGIGAVAPVGFADSALLCRIEAEIVEPTLAGLIKEGIDYRGTLFFGLMITREGPKVLEYNCRFGDPETQVVLPLLDADLAELMLDCLNGRLDRKKVRFLPLCACCVVLTSCGYPEAPKLGASVVGLEQLQGQANLRVFHAGTKRESNGQL